MQYKKIGKSLMGMLLVISMMLIGCGKNNSEPIGNIGVDSSSTIVAAYYRDIRDLNPHLYSGELYAQNLLFESLVKINESGEVEPWLAESWQISEDGKTYVFKLREDVSFSDGVKFNAASAKANFDAILDNADRHNWLESVALMKAVNDAGGESVEVTGEYEITIRLSESYYPFLIDLGLIRPFRFISPNCFIDGTTKNGVNGLSGTGAYVLKENHIDEYAIFEANPIYWGEQPDAKQVIVKVIPDNQSRIMALKNGEVDIIFGQSLVDASTYLEFEEKDGFNTVLSEPTSTRMMMINTTDEILGDVKVRQAIQHGVDRVLISEGIFDGIELPAETLLSEATPYMNLGLEPYDYNLDKAKALLDEAGWMEVEGQNYRIKEGQELRVTLHYSNDNVEEKTLAQFFQYEMSKIGIAIDIIGEEDQAHSDRLKSGKFDIAFNVSWGAPYDPQSFVSAMTSSVHGDYMAQLGLTEKAEIDETIKKVLMSTNEEEREDYYRYIFTTLHKEAVYIPLTYERNRAIYSDHIEHVDFGASIYEIPFDTMRLRN